MFLSGRATSPSWMGGAVVLAEIASLQMEFLTLSYHLNDTTWMEKVQICFALSKAVE